MDLQEIVKRLIKLSNNAVCRQGDPPKVISLDDGIALLEAATFIQTHTNMSYHEVACLMADFCGDTCACNWNDNDEWLPMHCDYAETTCPDPGGVACWEQYLKYRHLKEKT